MINLPVPVSNGWKLYFHPSFRNEYRELVRQVNQLRQKDPTGYIKKNATKKLIAIDKLAFNVIPQDPMIPEYRQGTTLGDNHKHWFRAKFFQQYRLFFRYHLESKTIAYAWVNDDKHKRAYGSKNDAYKVFAKMLESGDPPDDWNEFLLACENQEINRNWREL